MKEREIYQKIGELLWRIMPEDAIQICFMGSIYPDYKSGITKWLLGDASEKSFDLGKIPYEIEDEIMLLINILKETSGYSWNHYVFTLNECMDFSMKFAYIPEEDYWVGLCMRGISDLTKEEAENEYFIPLEIWEERVRLKNTNKE